MKQAQLYFTKTFHYLTEYTRDVEGQKTCLSKITLNKNKLGFLFGDLLSCFHLTHVTARSSVKQDLQVKRRKTNKINRTDKGIDG